MVLRINVLCNQSTKNKHHKHICATHPSIHQSIYLPTYLSPHHDAFCTTLRIYDMRTGGDMGMTSHHQSELCHYSRERSTESVHNQSMSHVHDENLTHIFPWDPGGKKNEMTVTARQVVHHQNTTGLLTLLKVVWWWSTTFLTFSGLCVA